MSPPLKVFISYARKDASMCEALGTHLASLRYQELIEDWYDGEIVPGEEWAEEIKLRLQEAHIILLLVSADFLASRFIRKNELTPAMERHQAGVACVIPVILRNTVWENAPFAKLQVLPKNALPINKWADPDDAYVSVVEGVKRAVTEIQKKLTTPVIDPPPSATIKPAQTRISVPSKRLLRSKRSVEMKEFSPPQLSFSFEIVTVSSTRGIIKGPTKSVNYYQESLGNSIDLDMVMIPGGSFLMGSAEGETGSYDDEKPQHQVTVPSFLMGKYAVTQAQWAAVAKFPKVKIDLKPEPSGFKGANLPVENVSWYEAEEFCARLSKQTGKAYRLPSEAEWEYACRAGTTMPFHFGEMITTDLANYDGNATYGSGPKGQYRETTVEVGKFSPNAFGLYDMHGNVWEWCADHWHSSYEGAPTDGSAWLSNDKSARRQLRGGSWNLNAQYCRSAYRFHDGPVRRDSYSGFRCSIAFGNAS